MAISQEKQESIQRQLKELKEGIAAARAKMKKDSDKQIADFTKSVEEISTKITEYNDKVMDRLENELEELSKDPEIAEKIAEAQENPNSEQVMGDIAAAEENMRLAREYSDAQWNSALLKAQMSVNEIKAKRAERYEEMDKADRAMYINNVLDYAADCQNMAEAYMLEADLALAEAVREIDAYEKDYGETL